jgi:hypothetical protein
VTRACVADASVAGSADFPCESILKRHLLHSRGCENWRCSFSARFGDGRHHDGVGRVVTFDAPPLEEVEDRAIGLIASLEISGGISHIEVR